jgi:YD repeat-containing protein
MKLMERMACQSPLHVEAGTAGTVVFVHTPKLCQFGKSIFHPFQRVAVGLRKIRSRLFVNRTWKCGPRDLIGASECNFPQRTVAGGMSVCAIHKIYWLLLLFACFQTEIALAYNIGDKVETTATVNVRQTAAGTSLGTQSSGTIGTITAGPTVASLNGTQYTWWDINFSSSPNGWVADANFESAPPTVTTTAATSVTATSATLNGTVYPNSSSTTIYFQYGLTTSYGSQTSSGSIGTTAGSYGTSVSGLTPNTPYHFRVVAYNGTGLSQGNDMTFTTSVQQLPNLTPYQPSGWSDKIVVARTASSTTDSTSLTTADTLYVNAAVINNGAAATAVNFNNEVYVDGTPTFNWVTVAPLSVGSYTYLTTGYSIGQLSAGTHTIEVVADYGGAIAESNEGDNTYTKTITVSNPAQPNLTPYQPSGWSDKIIVSRTANSTTDSTSLTTADTLYVNAAIINNGTAATTVNFNNEFYVDGVPTYNWVTVAPLNVGYYSYLTSGYSIGQLSAGTHTIEVVADYGGVIAESNEGDNTYSKTITVASLSVPTVQTLPATSIGSSTATLNAQIINNGGATILAERFSWGSTPSCSDGYTSAVTVNGTNFSYNLAEIPPGTYYFQAWAENSVGWGNSAAASFNTVSAPAPTISSVNPQSPTGSSTSQPFYINGANFVSGCNVILRDLTAGQTYANRTITTFSSTQIRIDPIFTTAAHLWSVEIQNPDSQTTGQFQFNVVAPGTPTLTVNSPTSTTTWTSGTAQTISWTVNGTPNPPINYFGMNYSLNGGTTWQTYGYFAASSASSGTWSIPSTIASSQAIVQIIAVNASGVAMFWNQSPAFTISAPGQNPVANPTADNHAPQSGQQVNFTGTGSTDPTPGCSINSYLWNFGDGSTSTLPNPSHAFSSPAGSSKSYTVSLQVSDTCGRNGTSSLYIYVTGQALGNNNSTQPTSKDPVNLATGNYVYNHLDIQIPRRGLPFEFQRYYNSKAAASANQPLGFGWTHSYNIYLSINSSNSAVIAFGDGHQETYATNGAGGYISEPGIYNVLTASGGNYTLTTKEQQNYNFNSSGQLTTIVDKNNNTVSLAYTGIKLTTITNTVGRVISFAYNANNCLTNITDPLGRTVQFAYDANTNLIRVMDTRGGLTQFGYDQYHQMTNAIDPRGNTFVSMQYDLQKRVVFSQKDALQNATTFTYDFVNNVTTVTDAMNNVSYNYYDSQLRVVRTVDNLGNQQIFQYDTINNRTMVVDKNGAVTTYAYDGNGNVIAKTNSFAQPTTIAYDALNNPTNRVDAQNGLTVFRYDAKGNLTNTFNSLNKTNIYQYDAFGEPVIVTDANGNSITNTYDSFGNLIETQDALGDTNGFTYDVVGRKLKQVDALGRTNLFIYDNADNLTALINALGKTNYFSFDGNNNRVTATDFNGNTTTSVYDPKDRLIIVRDPLGGSITNDYDALDRKIHVWDAMGGVTRYGYDANGNLLAVTNATGGVTLYAYDPNGNRTNSIDALGNSTTFVFDSLNRLVSTTDALGHTTTSVYDALGRRIQGIDALNRTNFFAYDSMGRLTNFTDTAGGTVVNTCDNVGNRLLSTDPDGHTTTNVFDALNRLVKTTNPAGGITQLGYDAVGNLISRKDPNGNTITYLYDANNHRTKTTYPAGTPVTFGYDNNGNRTSMTDALGTTTYSYDALNRLTSVTDCYGQTVSYGYDKDGNRTSITYPGNLTVRYAYDAANRLKSVTDWLNNTTTYNYDADGNLTSSVNPNGTAAAYHYDPANRLMSLTNTDNSAVISSYQYTLDAVGNHSQVSQTEQLPTIPVVGQVHLRLRQRQQTNRAGRTDAGV